MGLIFTRVKSRDRVAGCDGMEAKVGGGTEIWGAAALLAMGAVPPGSSWRGGRHAAAEHACAGGGEGAQLVRYGTVRHCVHPGTQPRTQLHPATSQVMKALHLPYGTVAYSTPPAPAQARSSQQPPPTVPYRNSALVSHRTVPGK